jgi:alkylhydroperoxidase/carboxymuconolactone decarboxylase family protein YurZ
MSHDERIEQLREKYGARTVDNALRTTSPSDFLAWIEWADELDPSYAKLLLAFTHGGMYTRGILDARTRCLVVVGQMVAMDEMEELPIHIRGALHAGATPREVLEVILQTSVYLGYSKARRAARICKQVLTESGRLHEITAAQRPVDGGRSARSLEHERASWNVTLSPRIEELLRKYSWQSLSPGLRLQPTHHVQSVERMDRVDQHFNKLWLDYIYSGMYARGVLDDKTRILCVVGELFVMGDLHQAENHIRNALAQGASPREVLEVILQSTIYAGMPRFVRFVGLLEAILEKEGRLAEITETQLPL